LRYPHLAIIFRVVAIDAPYKSEQEEDLMKASIFEQCQSLFPEWADLSMVDFDLDDPKGFSSFTMGIRSKQAAQPLQPEAVLYRCLEGKDNAILDFETEKQVFLALGANNIAAQCLHYDETCRIEAFYQGVR
jgi:hypothetical protein